MPISDLIAHIDNIFAAAAVGKCDVDAILKRLRFNRPWTAEDGVPAQYLELYAAVTDYLARACRNRKDANGVLKRLIKQHSEPPRARKPTPAEIEAAEEAARAAEAEEMYPGTACESCGLAWSVDMTCADWPALGFPDGFCEDCCCGGCGGRKKFCFGC